MDEQFQQIYKRIDELKSQITLLEENIEYLYSYIQYKENSLKLMGDIL